MYGQSDIDRFIERASAMLTGIVNRPEFEPGEWLDPKHRFGGVLQMIRNGASDSEISAKYAGVTGDVLKMFHKIAEGKLLKLEPQAMTKEQIKSAKKREAERMAAYRKRYCKDRHM